MAKAATGQRVQLPIEDEPTTNVRYIRPRMRAPKPDAQAQERVSMYAAIRAGCVDKINALVGAGDTPENVTAFVVNDALRRTAELKLPRFNLRVVTSDKRAHKAKLLRARFALNEAKAKLEYECARGQRIRLDGGECPALDFDTFTDDAIAAVMAIPARTKDEIAYKRREARWRLRRRPDWVAIIAEDEERLSALAIEGPEVDAEYTAQKRQGRKV